MEAFWIILAVLGGIALIAAVIGYVIFRIACRSKPDSSDKLPDMTGSPYEPLANSIKKAIEHIETVPHETVVLESFDGLKLSARVIPAENAERTVICMHGYRSLALIDFAVFVEEYTSRGYNVILPDERACGNSEGKYITFGINESRDCLMWLNYAKERFGGKLFLHGLSLGAATVMMTLRLDYPKELCAVCADCGFTSPYEILRHVLKWSFHLPEFPFLYLGCMFTRPLAKFGVKDADTRDILKNNRIPILFIHGQKDNFVPYRMSDENFDANAGEKQIVKTENTTHAMSFYDERERCENALFEFFGKR